MRRLGWRVAPAANFCRFSLSLSAPGLYGSPSLVAKGVLMATMTSRERYRRMYEHRGADRVPIIDSPWPATIERWQSEGLPEGVPFYEYLDLDPIIGVGADVTPRFPTKVVEETDRYIVETTAWGVTMRNWKHAASTPEYIDFTVTSPDEWRKVKDRLTPSRDRVNWEHLETNYPQWREKGYCVRGNLWFGFDVTHAAIVGTERLLMAMVTDPEWLVEMWNHELDMGLAHLDMIWEAGYRFDAVYWPDDMGYKQNQFFSVDTYRELLKPVHARAVEWAHAKGVYAHLHSCGDVRPFVPELLDIGVDALNPLEVKAGMDPVALKKEHGDRLLLHGGVSALLYEDFDKLEVYVRRTLPILKENGGYIFSTDHSVPSCISLQDFGRLVALAKELGSYE